MGALHVLFVCTGNICRSPTAEAVLRTLGEARGMAEQIEVDSAATHGYNVGLAPDPHAVRAAALRGYEMIALRARQVCIADHHRFDLMLAMDRDNLRHMERQRPPDGHARLALLLDYAPETAAMFGHEVPDPYGGDARDFEFALDLVEQGVRGLLNAIRAQ